MKKAVLITVFVVLIYGVVSECKAESRLYEGIYSKQDNPSESTELKQDGSFVVKERGATIKGSYSINGSTLTLIAPEMGVAKGHIDGDKIIDDQNQVWVKTESDIRTEPLITSNNSDLDSAKNWKFHELDGEEIELGKLKGKVIFINIWATWCMPCIYEMQSIQKLYDTFKNEEVTFLIASNENKEIVKKLYEDKKYTFPVHLIDRVLPQQFQSPIIPSTYIIDRKGMIALRHSGAVDWNQQSVHKYINSLLANEMDSPKIAKPFPDSGNNLMGAKMMREQRLNIAKSMATSRLEPFAEQHNLPPDIKEKLIDIRVEEQVEMTELISGNNSTYNREYEFNKIRSDSDNKIFRLLSEEQYGAYQRYKRFENEWVTVSEINKAFEFHSMPLDKDQQEQLVVAMYNDRQEMMAKQRRDAQQGAVASAQSQGEMMKRELEYQKELYGMYCDSVQNLLTEPQLKQFIRYFDNLIYTLEKSLINRTQ